MPILKTKLSKSAWLLLLLIPIAIIVLVVLHFTYHAVGFGVDLTFVAEWFMAVMMWGASDAWSGLLLCAGIFALGVLFYYALKKYILGTEIPTGAINTYTPVGAGLSQTQPKDEETVVSS